MLAKQILHILYQKSNSLGVNEFYDEFCKFLVEIDLMNWVMYFDEYFKTFDIKDWYCMIL